MSLYKEEIEELSKPNNDYIAGLLKDFPQYKSLDDIKVNEQDSSRLSRGVAQGTIVETKDNNRIYDIPIALSLDSWDQPMSPFNASYPYNSVYESRNGHVQEFDDTEGSERYHRYHPSGTFVEVDSEGNEVRKIVGDNFLIIEKDGMVYIKGDCNLTVDGSCKILVLNDCNLNVKGSLNGLVENDINLTTNGCMNLNVKETFKIRADNMVVETSKFNHKNIGMYTLSTNSKDEIVTDKYVLKLGTFSIMSSDEMILASEGKISVKTDMHLQNNLYVEDEIHCPDIRGTVQRALYSDGANKAFSAIVATSLSGASAPEVVTPSPTAPELSAAIEPAEALSTGLIIPGVRANAAPPRIVKSFPNTRLSRIAIENDGGDGASAVNLYPGYSRGSPYIDPNDNEYPDNIESGRAVSFSAGSSSAQIRKVPSEIQIYDSKPSNVISKYFTVADLSSRAAFPHSVREQNGLSELDICKNLQELAINVADRLVEEYGRNSFIITSGFRPYSGKGNPSQHELGQAVDIQFKIPVDEYPKRAEELTKILVFDQLLLEYQSGGTGRPWFHISYSNKRIRREYATYYNHKPISSFTKV